MTELEAIFQEILAHPDDDLHRRVYADWLEEYGDDLERAEFIRIQCDLETHLDDSCRKQLMKRERELLAAHERAWAAPLRGIVGSWHYRRGFIERVTMTAANFLSHGKTLFCLAPVRSLWCNWIVTEEAKVLASSPYLANLTSLKLSFGSLVGTERVTELVSSPHLVNLTSLDLSNNSLGTEGTMAVAASSLLVNLTSLKLRKNGIGTEGAKVLASSPHLANLTSLDLSDYDIGAEGADALASSPHLANLTSLDLSLDSRW